MDGTRCSLLAYIPSGFRLTQPPEDKKERKKEKRTRNCCKDGSISHSAEKQRLIIIEILMILH
jgi:hypothetical protein